MVEYIRYRMPEDEGDRFVASYERAGKILARSPHCLGWELRRGVEEPEQFVARIEWDSQEGHETGFRASDLYEPFLSHLRPFSAYRKEMSHYDVVAGGEG